MLPALPPEEMAVAVAAWVEVLQAAEIPEDRIGDCYLEAMSTRGKTSYPLVASELCAIWGEIKPADRPSWMASPKPVGYFEKQWNEANGK